MNTAVIIEKEWFDALLNKVDNLSSEINMLKREVSKDSKLYNITESARLLNISTVTLHKLIKHGLIETKTVGNSTYFTRGLLDKYLAQK